MFIPAGEMGFCKVLMAMVTSNRGCSRNGY